MCALAESKSKNLFEFLMVFARLKSRGPHLRKGRTGLIQKEKKPYKKNWLADAQTIIDEVLRGKKSGIAY